MSAFVLACSCTESTPGGTLAITRPVARSETDDELQEESATFESSSHVFQRLDTFGAEGPEFFATNIKQHATPLQIRNEYDQIEKNSRENTGQLTITPTLPWRQKHTSFYHFTRNVFASHKSSLHHIRRPDNSINVSSIRPHFLIPQL